MTIIIIIIIIATDYFSGPEKALSRVRGFPDNNEMTFDLDIWPVHLYTI